MTLDISEHNTEGHNQVGRAHVSSNISKDEARKNWINDKREELLNRASMPSADTLKIHIVQMEGYYQAGYRLSGKGYIHFDSGDWIYLVSNSSHDDEITGDITLAMDNQRRFYINVGHVCGGIIRFTTGEVFESLDADLFFRYFTDDQDNTAWQAFTVD